MNKFIEILKKHQVLHQVLKQITAEENFCYILQKRPKVEIKKREGSSIEANVSQSVSNDKIQLISDQAEKQQLNVDINQSLPEGMPFQDYGEVENVLDDNKSSLKHQKGEVLLVDVWATWCGPCQKPMQHNQHMLETNQQTWGKNVRIVGLSVDDDKKIVEKRVNDKKWTNIQHLTLNGWNGDHKLIKDFGINGIPFVCLVDKFGKINYKGHPSQINLQERINTLLAQEKEQIVASETTSQPEKLKNTDQILKLLTPEFIQKEFHNTQLLCVKLTIKKELKKGKITQQVKLEPTVMEGDNQTKQKFRQTFEKLVGTEIKFIEVKYIDIPHVENPTCWECKAALQLPYYWLYWEEGTHFCCRNCVEKKPESAQQHYNYRKNSILLTGQWNKVSLKTLGHNIQPEDISKVEHGHMFYCNGCGAGAGLGEARYICLGCRSQPNYKGDYVDICPTCLECLAKGGEQALNKRLQPDGHVLNHPLLRVLYNVKGYYDY